MDFDELLAAYDYKFPQELIAKVPACPRDSARLLVYDRAKDSVVFDTFSNITEYLPKNAVLVFNETKVIPAKMSLKKKTGGGVSALIIGRREDSLSVFASGSFNTGDVLQWQSELSFEVQSRRDQEAILKPNFPMSTLDELLEKYGETPLPPYMKDSPLSEKKRRREYQTVFAFNKGSVACPTAGLHFTKKLIKKIEQSGRSVCYVSLTVGLGTFAPLTESNISSQTLHHEYYSIDPETAMFLNRARSEGRPIIAVGTTSVRTLESASEKGQLKKLTGSTNLFITESSILQFADALITNFHVPRSSLLMLVSAFTGREKLRAIYEQAIEERIRLFSFGDGMLIV